MVLKRILAPVALMGLKRTLALVALVLAVLMTVCFGLLPVGGHVRTIVPTLLILGSVAFFVVHPYEESNRVLMRVVAIIAAIGVIAIAVTPILLGWKAHEIYGLVGAVAAALAAVAGPVFVLLQTDRKILDKIDKLTDDLATAETDLATTKSEKETAEADTAAATERAEAAEKEAAEEREAKETAQADLATAQRTQGDLQKQVDGLNTELSQTQKSLQESQEEVALYLSENTKLEAKVAALSQTQQTQPAQDGGSTVEIVVEAQPTPATPQTQPVTTHSTPSETDAVIVPAATETPVEEVEENVIDGAVVLMKDPSGRTVIKESAIPQTAVYLHKVEEDEGIVAFEVCSTDVIDGPLCVGVLSTRNGKKDKEMYFCIPAGKKKAKRLIRVPRGSNIGLEVVEYLHLNPGGEVLSAFNITELPAYRVQGCQSAIQSAEVFVVDAA